MTKESFDRVQENRQIKLAKSILESAGYKVEKLKESLKWKQGGMGAGGSDQYAIYKDIKLVVQSVDLSDMDEEEMEYYGFDSTPSNPYVVDVRDLDNNQTWIEGVSGTPYRTEEEAKKAAEEYALSKYGDMHEAEGVRVNKNDDYLADEEDIAGSLDYLKSKMMTISQVLDNYGGVDLFRQERDGTQELDIPCEMLGGDYDSVYTISEDDVDAREVMEIFHDMDRKDIKTVHMPGQGYNILVEVPGMGQFVYQNQYGYICLFKKF